jgi:hypothetical protein
MDHIIEKVYTAPLVCKIMTFMVVKNIGYSFYQGIRDFKNQPYPMTNLFGNMIFGFIYGMGEALFWPLALVSMMDDIAIYCRKKLMA